MNNVSSISPQDSLQNNIIPREKYILELKSNHGLSLGYRKLSDNFASNDNNNQEINNESNM